MGHSVWLHCNWWFSGFKKQGRLLKFKARVALVAAWKAMHHCALRCRSLKTFHHREHSARECFRRCHRQAASSLKIQAVQFEWQWQLLLLVKAKMWNRTLLICRWQNEVCVLKLPVLRSQVFVAELRQAPEALDVWYLVSRGKSALCAILFCAATNFECGMQVQSTPSNSNWLLRASNCARVSKSAGLLACAQFCCVPPQFWMLHAGSTPMFIVVHFCTWKSHHSTLPSTPDSSSHRDSADHCLSCCTVQSSVVDTKTWHS